MIMPFIMVLTFLILASASYDVVCGPRVTERTEETASCVSALIPFSNDARMHELKGVGRVPLVKGARQLARILCLTGE